ncbi:MAG: trigger factor [Proteobacteria bacterium]|nr:trigger factor [Pseudomonadota bacterium]
MQVSIESTGNLGRRVTFKVPSTDFNDKVGSRLREIARDARIKGFRPGKVPASVIDNRYGDQIRSEILDGMLREGFGKAVEGQDLRIAGNPRIVPNSEAAAEGELAYVADFELVPDFGDIDATKLNVVRHTAEVTDEDIDRMVENLRMQRQSWSPVQRAAKSGDLVDVEMSSEVDGQRMPPQGVESASTVLGSAQMLPALETALEGVEPGAEKDIEIAFPADWRIESLAGKTAKVHAKVTQVAEAKLPEIDQAFIRSFGVRSGEMEQFRNDIRQNLERELKGALMYRLRREVGEALVKEFAGVELPPRLVQDEAQGMANAEAEQARQNGAQVVEAVPGPYADAARKRVLVGLLVGEVARQNKLSLDSNRLVETLRLIASTYEEPQQVVDLYRNDPQLMQGLQNRVMEEQVIDWIAGQAQHTEQAMSFQDAIRAE